MKKLILICLLFLPLISKAQLTVGKIPVAITPVGSATSSLGDGPITVIGVDTTFGGAITSTIVNGATATELSYLSGVTSALQTQINAKQPSFVTGLGVTNNGGVLSNNIAAGANITLTKGANGLITFSTGSGGTVGSLINTANTIAGQLVQFSDNQKTNTSPVTLGLGITNNAGMLSNNIVAGSQIALTSGANGQETIATTGLVIGTDIQAHSVNLDAWSAITTASKQAAFTTGLGITNNANVLSNNIVAGSNITLTGGANGQITIAASGGGGGTVGTTINTTATVAGMLATFSDTQKTNLVPISTGLGITNNGGFLSNNIVAGSSITLTAGGSGQITITATQPVPRIQTLTDSATVTPDVSVYEGGKLLTLSQNTTIANPTGSPSSFQNYVLRIKSTTSRTLTFGSQYRGSTDVTLLSVSTTSGSSGTDYLIFRYNSDDTKWDLVGKNFNF